MLVKHLFSLAAILAVFFTIAGIAGCSAAATNLPSEVEADKSFPLLPSGEETNEDLPLLPPEGETNENFPLPPSEKVADSFTDTGETSPDDELSPYGPSSMVPCTNGLLIYYNQSDPRWGDELYGVSDYLKTHGCGPTAVAMVVSSFTTEKVTPMDVAQWASDNGYCSKGEGSLHALIPDGLAHYGLPVKPLEDRSEESVLQEIRHGNIIIVLMNRGYFTESGHFLLITQVTEDGKLRIADPASWENSQKTWDVDFILGQARKKSDAGGPFWVVSLPEED